MPFDCKTHLMFCIVDLDIFNDCHKSTMKKLIWLTVEANDHH